MISVSPDVASTACSIGSSRISSSPSRGLETPSGGDHGYLACLLEDTPAASPRITAADIRREEERSEREVNATRQRLLAQKGARRSAYGGAPEGAAQRGPLSSEVTNKPTESTNYGDESQALPVNCASQ